MHPLTTMSSWPINMADAKCSDFHYRERTMVPVHEVDVDGLLLATHHYRVTSEDAWHRKAARPKFGESSYSREAKALADRPGPIDTLMQQRSALRPWFAPPSLSTCSCETPVTEELSLRIGMCCFRSGPPVDPKFFGQIPCW